MLKELGSAKHDSEKCPKCGGTLLVMMMPMAVETPRGLVPSMQPAFVCMVGPLGNAGCFSAFEEVEDRPRIINPSLLPGGRLN